MAHSVVPAGAASAARVPPHNLDAEEALLAACIIDGAQEVMAGCLEARLQPESFYKPAHQIIYQVFLDLYREGTPVDEVTVTNALSSRPLSSINWLEERHPQSPKQTLLLELVGGPSTLTSLLDRIETHGHARYWREIVREKWLLRRLIATSSRIADQAYTQQDSLDHFIDSVESQILQINEERVADSAQKFDVAVDEAANLINRILSGHNEEGVMTGYKDLDDMTFGLHGGQMIVLAARPSMGKTSLGLNITENVAIPREANRKPHSVLVFSLEMPSDQLAMRMLCGRAKVNMKRVRDRMVGKDQMRELTRVAGELKQAPIWIDDSSGMNILELRAKARRLHQQHGIKLIVVDYLQLIAGTDARVQREQQISEISRGIKAMAKELSVPVLILSQLNRAAEKENRQPRLSDLRESGAIEQDADMVFLLATPEKKGQKDNDEVDIPQAARERLLIIAKQRNGPTGSVPLTFIPDFTRFENYSAALSES